jgi:hypothetical protein
MPTKSPLSSTANRREIGGALSRRPKPIKAYSPKDGYRHQRYHIRDWIISLIAPVHAKHSLRYITPGETELPAFAELDSFCEELIGHGAQLLREIGV